MSGRRALKYALLDSSIPLKAQLARGFLRGRERYMVLTGRREPCSEADGVPIPPARLRVLVAGTADVEWFLDSGKAQADYLRGMLAEVGHRLEGMDTILDFGCGCGRIARWFADLERTQLNGCDYNPQLIEWCNANLQFMSAQVTHLEPPLPYPDGRFDFLYAFSVFTHLSVELAGRWMDELARVIRPGGFIWFTLHGDSYRERLSPDERRRFDDGEIVVRLPEIEGTNLCGAYWPQESVERMLGARFELLAHLDPEAESVRAQEARMTHDAYLARRTQA